LAWRRSCYRADEPIESAKPVDHCLPVGFKFGIDKLELRAAALCVSIGIGSGPLIGMQKAYSMPNHIFKVPMGLDHPVECKSPLEAGIISYSRWS